MLTDQNKIMLTKMVCKSMSRRAFLQQVAHLSLLSATLVIVQPLTLRLVQAAPQVGGYGSGGYGQGIYPGSISFSREADAAPAVLDHSIYLPLISKED